jgi:hypothetical protein
MSIDLNAYRMMVSGYVEINILMGQPLETGPTLSFELTAYLQL